MYRIPRTVGLACGYALAGWALFTGLLVALGNLVLPAISRPVAPAVVAGLTTLTALVVAGLTVDFCRRAGRHDAAAALTLGTCLAAVGLGLDGVLLLATRFRYPNVDEAKTATLTILLLLGYAVAAAVPPVVASVRSSRSGRLAQSVRAPL